MHNVHGRTLTHARRAFGALLVAASTVSAALAIAGCEFGDGTTPLPPPADAAADGAHPDAAMSDQSAADAPAEGGALSDALASSTEASIDAGPGEASAEGGGD